MRLDVAIIVAAPQARLTPPPPHILRPLEKGQDNSTPQTYNPGVFGVSVLAKGRRRT